MIYEEWDKDLNAFLKLCRKHQVRILMVGGGAVNFHGYQRHSAYVDFWLDVTEENLQKLILVLNALGYEISSFPEEIKNREQNISIKFSPTSINLELITRLSIGKSFDEALSDSEIASIDGQELLKWNVLSFDDLIDSKIKSGRPKDLLDIQELKRLKQKE